MGLHCLATFDLHSSNPILGPKSRLPLLSLRCSDPPGRSGRLCLIPQRQSSKGPRPNHEGKMQNLGSSGNISAGQVSNEGWIGSRQFIALLRLVGNGEARQLPWRFGFELCNVCDVWDGELVALDVRNIYDCFAHSSLLEGRRKMLEEIWKVLGGVLQDGSMGHHSWDLLSGE
jgi:hypothetical protein